MPKTPYPDVLALDCLMEMGAILKDRTLSDRKIEFAQDFWSVQGYLQRTLLGEGKNTGFGSASVDIDLNSCQPSSEQLKEVADELQACCDECDEGHNNFSAKVLAEAEMNPMILLLLQQFGPALVHMLMKLLAKKKAAEDRLSGKQPEEELTEEEPTQGSDK